MDVRFLFRIVEECAEIFKRILERVVLVHESVGLPKTASVANVFLTNVLRHRHLCPLAQKRVWISKGTPGTVESAIIAVDLINLAHLESVLVRVLKKIVMGAVSTPMILGSIVADVAKSAKKVHIAQEEVVWLPVPKLRPVHVLVGALICRQQIAIVVSVVMPVPLENLA